MSNKSVAENDLKIEYGEYDRNRRYDVPKGTRFVHVTKYFWPRETSLTAAADEVIDAAWSSAREKYGEFDHEQVEYIVAYFSMQVLIEFRVRPRDA